MSSETFLSHERAASLAALRADPTFQAAPPDLQDWLVCIALGDEGVAETRRKSKTKRQPCRNRGEEGGDV